MFYTLNGLFFFLGKSQHYILIRNKVIWRSLNVVTGFLAKWRGRNRSMEKASGFGGVWAPHVAWSGGQKGGVADWDEAMGMGCAWCTKMTRKGQIGGMREKN